MYKLIALALATAVTAFPAGAPSTELKNGEFYTYLSVVPENGFSLNAMKNGTSEDLLIVGERVSVYPGTPTVTERNLEDAGESVSFIINGEKYGWVVPDVGHVWGNVQPVVARKGYHDDFKFHSENKMITHDLTATTNHFMACDSSVNGLDVLILAWGNQYYNNGLPEGCKFTDIAHSDPEY